ncbi:DUF4258 domain-containing protein [Vreelandella neptunia]|uniref:DUF4258 domain-containing protein n=1 Tax=Vreelandella neptunia TaxID=115551 RepID=UPI003159BFA6
MYSNRFKRNVHVTRHAWERMQQREIDEAQLCELLETGETRYKDQTRLWIAKAFAQRSDNLVCAAVVLENQLIVKTVMHHFEWEEMS